MKHEKIVTWISVLLLILSGILWATTAWGYNFVETYVKWIFVIKLIYSLIGVAAVWVVYALIKRNISIK